jgi:putative salt-induced outer membrane protein YdiY
MGRMRKVILLVVAVGCWMGGEAAADQLVLKNGDRLTGTIVGADGKSVWLKTEYVGEVRVAWTGVEAITSEEPLHVTLEDERMLVGTVATAEGKIEVQTEGAGEVPVALDTIRALRSAEAQRTYEAEQERLRHPGWLERWAGSVDAGVSSVRGNADTFTFNLALRAARTTERDRLSTYFTSLVAENSTTGVSVTTANAVRAGARYDINLGERLFTFSFTDFEFDEFQQLDLRNVLGGGLGLHVRKTERTKLQLFGGGSFTQEFFSTGLTRRSVEGVLGEELSYKPTNSTFLTGRIVWFPNLSEPGEYRVTGDASAVVRLNSWLSWQTTISDRFITNPLLGVQKNDLLITTGIRVSFGKEGAGGQSRLGR